MITWFQNTISEIMSFFSGVILTIFVLVVGPIIKEKIVSRKETTQLTVKEHSSVEEQYRTKLIQSLQKQHLSADFFALDEIATEPVFVLPSSKMEPSSKEDQNAQSLIKRWLPFVPNAIKAISLIPDQQISFREILKEKQRLVIHGEFGVGKSFSLAWLALELGKKSVEFSKLSGGIPFYFQAGSLVEFIKRVDDSQTEISELLPPFYHNQSSTQFRQLFRQAIEQNKAVFFIDNIDTLPKDDQRKIFEWIENNPFISKQAPLLISTSNQTLPNFEKTSLFPVTLGYFDEARARKFLSIWNNAWDKNLSEFQAVDSLVRNEWILGESVIFSPYYLTLKVLALCLGDIISSDEITLLKSYIFRQSNANPHVLAILNALAEKMLSENKIEFSASEFEVLYKEKAIQLNEERKKLPKIKEILSSHLFNSSYSTNRNTSYTFKHISLFAQFIARSENIEKIIEDIPRLHSTWLISDELLKNIGMLEQITETITVLANKKPSFTQSSLFRLFGLLPYLNPKAPLFTALLKNIYASLKNDEKTYIHKIKLIDLLVSIDSKYTQNIFYALLKSEDSMLQRFGIIGSGINKDKKTTKAIFRLGNENIQANSKYACLALSMINTKESIDLLAKNLLSANFILQKHAAEALALNSTQGHGILKEGLRIETISVRRACCYGLGHIREDWSIEILKELEINDAEWIVQSAATSTIEELEMAPLFSYKDYTATHNIPWLIEYASQYDIGISAGDSANQMMFDALEKGNTEQAFAASQFYFYHPDSLGSYQSRIQSLIEIDGVPDLIQANLYAILWYFETR